MATVMQSLLHGSSFGVAPRSYSGLPSRLLEPQVLLRPADAAAPHRRATQAQQQQHHPTTVAQVAAVPAFTDDGSTAAAAAAAAAAILAGNPDQKGWLPPAPWGNAQPQQQAQQQQQQQGVRALSEQQPQQEPEQQPRADPLLAALQQCSCLEQVAALVSSHMHQAQDEQQPLGQQYVFAALQQLCVVVQTSPAMLPGRQQQVLQSCLAAVADAALQQLPELGHAQVGQLLALLQQLAFRPEAPWMRSVLQHAATELVHYTPAELALLLLTATQTAARHGGLPGPDAPVVQLLPSGRPQPSTLGSYDGPSLVGPAAAADFLQQQVQQVLTQQQQQPGQQQQRSSRRTGALLTSAWLQHLLSTFQPYIACRGAHPQLAPAHMEAVISCLAALRVAPDRFWLYLFVRQMAAQLPACSPRSLARMLVGLATLGYRLPDHVLAAVERQMNSAEVLAALRPQECADVVRALAVLRPAPGPRPGDAWLQQLLAAAMRGSVHLSASGVVGVLAASAALGLQLEPSWIDALLLQARSALAAMSAHEHVWLMDALAQLQQQQQHQGASGGGGYRPGPLFMGAFMAQLSGHMPELSLPQQAALALGLATVGYQPSPAWMGAFMSRVLGQPLTGADGEALLALLRALRRMQYVPGPAIAQQLSTLIDAIQLSVPYPQLLLLREALDELQYQRGIMALPQGAARRAAEAAQAAAAAAQQARRAAAAAATQAQQQQDATRRMSPPEADEAATQQQQQQQVAAARDLVEAIPGVPAAPSARQQAAGY